MNYEETLNYLYNAAPAFEKVGAGAYKEGLSNTLAFDEHFGHPHRKYKTIHVAGTNGKGSTSHTLAAILQLSGYKVGLYTSPHLVDFNERIRVNGEPISHEYVVDFVNREKDFFESFQPSFFELTTALAFKYFADQQVDIAVIEVGLGGRLDCTNIITPILSVITNISFDHTAFLGDTLEKIAGEKAGIIKQGVPVVIGEYVSETRPVFEKKAREMNAPITFAQDVISDTEVSAILPYCQLRGACQKANTRTILCAASSSSFPQKKETDTSNTDFHAILLNAFSHVCDLTGLRGRWETIQESPLVVCDTGHNLAGWEYLAPQIKSTHEHLLEISRSKNDSKEKTCELRIVFGMVDDKDVTHVMQLLPKDARYYFTQADTHRAIPVDKLTELASSLGLKGTPYPTVKAAYEAALDDSTPDDFIFVGGSSYVVADFLS